MNGEDGIKVQTFIINEGDNKIEKGNLPI